MHMRYKASLWLGVCAISLAAIPMAHAQKAPIEIIRLAKFKAVDVAGSKPCPRSNYPRDGGAEGAALALAGLVTTFVDKAFDALTSWLEKRKERLSGTRTARLTGDFYYDGKPKTGCYIFTVGTFGNQEEPIDWDIYIEFVPVFLDSGNAFTLQPVYLDYRHTVAEEPSGKGKLTSMAISYKYTQPITKEDDGEVSATALKEGGGFLFTFGRLKENTRLDYLALAGVNGGLAYVPTKWERVVDGSKTLAPVAYEMTALWSESAEPSPLYNAFVGALKENKATITPEVAKALRDILGLPEPEE